MEVFMKHNTNNSPTIVTRWMRFLGAMVILALMVSAVAVSQPYSNPTALNLGGAANFRILAFTANTIDVTCTVTGNVGAVTVTHNGPIVGNLWGTTITGTGTVSGTTKDLTDGIVGTAQTNLTSAIATAAGLTFTAATGAALGAVEMGTLTLGRGIYVGPGTLGINSELILTGTATDIFIIRTGTPGTTLITGASCIVTMGGTALASNVYWIVGSSATILGDFKGNILAYTAITQTSGTINGRALARDGFVTLSGTSALPVEMVAFTAKANGMQADLRWLTATEANNYGFEIERRQTGNWEKIGFVAGAGASSSPRSYSYTDKNLSEGSYAYRIKQVNKDGSFAYHGSAQVQIGSVAKKFELASNFPNPFNPSTTVQFTLENDGVATLTVYNVLGQEVTTLFNDNAQAGKLYQVKFDASRLPTGLYFAKLQSGNQRMMQKMALVK